MDGEWEKKAGGTIPFPAVPETRHKNQKKKQKSCFAIRGQYNIWKMIKKMRKTCSNAMTLLLTGVTGIGTFWLQRAKEVLDLVLNPSCQQFSLGKGRNQNLYSEWKCVLNKHSVI